MNFKTWLEGLEEYEPFKSKIEKAAAGRKFPFEHWWPAGQNRVEIPFDAEVSKSEARESIEELLADFKGLPTKGLPAADSYQLVDYKAGLARPAGKKNAYKIIRILDAMEQNEIAKINADLEANRISAAKAKQEIASWKKYLETPRQEFMNDPVRAAKKSGLKVIISKDIHDLGAMSTGRGWTSCMHLGTGIHKKDVYCEVKNGGFVAYLVRDGDEDIKSPIARIHIRRFDNPKGQSVAVPEDEVYGADTPALKNAVNNWIASKQGEPKAGVYKRRGGKYSDTFPKERKMILTPLKKDPKYYEKYFRKWLAYDRDERVRDPKKSMFLDLYKKLVAVSDPSKIDKDVAFKVGEVLFPEIYGNSDVPYGSAFNEIMLCDFMKNFPQTVDKRIIDKVMAEYKSKIPTKRTSNFDRHCAPIMLKHFYNLLDDEQKSLIKPDSMSLRGKDVPKEFLKIYADNMKASMPEQLGLDKFKEIVDKHQGVYEAAYRISSHINEILSIIQHGGQLSPDNIRFLTNMADNTLPEIAKTLKDRYESAESDETKKKSIVNTIDKMVSKVKRDVINLFTSLSADTPTVVRFIQNNLNEILKHGGFVERYGFGHTLASLGANGMPFIPFLEKLIGIYEQMLPIVDHKDFPVRASKEDIMGNIEQIMYVIDSIKNDRYSTKYSDSPDKFSYAAETLALNALEKLK